MPKKVVKLIPYLFFVLVYGNQGLSSLPDQAIYYLTRETWGLSAGMVGLIGLITGHAWYIKMLWGFLVDYVPIGGYRFKNYLYLS